MIQQCITWGMDPTAIKNFLEKHGIAEENVTWILNYINDENYANEMKL